MSFDVTSVRRRFPALQRGNPPPAFLDGPAGTQVPDEVIEAVAQVYRDGISNRGDRFAASRRAGEVVGAARAAVADLINAGPHEIAFGQNMTSITFAASRAISRDWSEGDRILVTSLDHDANVTPWREAAADKGAVVDMVTFDTESGSLDPSAVAAEIDERTRLVAITAASNALGSVTQLEPVIAAAHAVGALTYVDAVHFSAHRLSDVAAGGTDFLVASAYKFFGPHTGFLYGRGELLESVTPYKVRPAPELGPDRWETGTQSFESLAGVAAAVEYLAGLGHGDTRRHRLETAFAAIGEHERALSRRFGRGLAEMPQISLYGPSADGDDRVSTFAISVGDLPPRQVAQHLGALDINVWDGDYYAVGVMEQLGRADRGGLVRVGFVHYNTAAEVDRLLNALQEMT